MHNIPPVLLQHGTTQALIKDFNIMLTPIKHNEVFIFEGDEIRLGLTGVLKVAYDKEYWLRVDFKDNKFDNLLAYPKARILSFTIKDEEYKTGSPIELNYTIKLKYRRDYNIVVNRLRKVTSVKNVNSSPNV